ncbi:hypothetical protein HMI48_09770 [Acidithiobacillus ferrooxidans]|uniref:ankyrin repeat domain-containing protein n=1 Tax=Acidithiobacillus ferrooxidans TaxID=920 RepID=UPI001C078EC7|nr:ankyrin repeat domain-containing protein [Acidithiobacillus ferrooxidans]MBU2774168.1 hypothetical protein [Acidithiobacillus ferrooxidans]
MGATNNMGKLARINAKKRKDNAIKKMDEAHLIIRETKDDLIVPLLFQACADNDVVLCHEILKSGVPVDSRNHQLFYSVMYDQHIHCGRVEEGWMFEGQPCKRSVRTPLMQCARHGHEELAISFIEFGADINIRDDDGAHLWHVAAAGMERLAKLLNALGASSNQRNQWNHTPLHFAAVSLIPLVVDSGCDKEVAGGEEGLTALEAAVRYNDPRKFFALLESGCSVDCLDSCDLMDCGNHRILGALSRLRPDLY